MAKAMANMLPNSHSVIKAEARESDNGYKDWGLSLV